MNTSKRNWWFDILLYMVTLFFIGMWLFVPIFQLSSVIGHTVTVIFAIGGSLGLLGLWALYFIDDYKPIWHRIYVLTLLAIGMITGLIGVFYCFGIGTILLLQLFASNVPKNGFGPLMLLTTLILLPFGLCLCGIMGISVYEVWRKMYKHMIL